MNFHGSSYNNTSTCRNSVEDTKCLNLLSKLPKPLFFTETKTKANFQIIVADPAVDTTISKFVHEHGIWDVHVQKALEKIARHACARGARAMDVGANLGFFTMSLLAMGCEVTSFEMQEDMVDRLTFSACSNGWSNRLTVRVGAVSDKRSTLRRVIGAGNLGGVGIVEKGGIAVHSFRIDDVMDLEKEIIVMKMDIEGYENKALLGMSKMFERRLVKNVVLEFTPSHIMGVTAATKMLETLYSYGFTKIYELDFMEPAEYRNPSKIRQVPTSAADWAAQFTNHIAEGGDSRGVRFTDLLLSLEF
jgi:FkbM family methyltransferase